MGGTVSPMTSPPNDHGFKGRVESGRNVVFQAAVSDAGFAEMNGEGDQFLLSEGHSIRRA